MPWKEPLGTALHPVSGPVAGYTKILNKWLKPIFDAPPTLENFLYPKTPRLNPPYLDVGQHCACGTIDFLSVTVSGCGICAYIKVTT